MKLLIRILAVLILLPGAALTESDSAADLNNARERNRKLVADEFTVNTTVYGKNPDVLVLPGLVADRGKRKIVLRAEATGLQGDSIVEFFIIGENSGHDYEALLVSMATPGDVRQALTFIGMQPGRSADPSSFAMWPKGERVVATVSSVNMEPVRIEKLVMDNSTGRTLPASGLVFTGSEFITPPHGGAEALAADTRDPASIASIYNEPESILDVPRIAPQSEIYETQVVNPNEELPAGNLFDVTIKPEYPGERKRVADLIVTAGVGGQAAKLHEMRFSMVETEDVTAPELMDINALLQKLVELVESGRDPFVTLKISETVTLNLVEDLCSLLITVENENGIRIEPPLQGDPYYRAFVPPRAFLDRKARLAQPWELTLKRGTNAVYGTLTKIEELWSEDRSPPELRLSKHPVESPAALRTALDRLGPGLPVILVFAGSNMTYGELTNFIRPALSTHGTVHVFVDEESD